MKIEKLKGRTREFAEACYDMNSLYEMYQALKGPADDGDCAEWEINKTDWRRAIQAALADRALDETGG